MFIAVNELVLASILIIVGTDVAVAIFVAHVFVAVDDVALTVVVLLLLLILMLL